METVELDTSSIFCDMDSSNSHGISRLNKELLLAEKFYKFQLEEEKQENSILVSEIDLLDRLLSESQSKSEKERERLIARYESQFEKLSAECELQRNETRYFENQINELVKKEGQVTKKLAEHEVITGKQKLHLRAVETENDELRGKLTMAEHRLMAAETTVQEYRQQKEQHRKLLCEECIKSQRSLVELKTKHEIQIQSLRTSSVNNQLLLEEKHSEGIIKLERSLGEESKKNKFLYEKVKVIDEISRYHKKLSKKFCRVNGAKEEVSEKYAASERDNKKLRGQVEELERLCHEDTLSSSQFKEEIRLLQRECEGLKVKEKCLLRDFKTISANRHNLEKQIERLESTVKESNQTIRKLKMENADILKTAKQTGELEEDKAQLSAKLEKVTYTTKQQQEDTNNKIQRMESEIKELKKDLGREKNKNFEIKQRQQQPNYVMKTNDKIKDGDESNGKDEYHYEDDFEVLTSSEKDEESCEESITEIETYYDPDTNKIDLFFQINKHKNNTSVPTSSLGDSFSAAPLLHETTQKKQRISKLSIQNAPTSKTCTSKNRSKTVTTTEKVSGDSLLPKQKTKNRGEMIVDDPSINRKDKQEKITATDIFRESLSVVIEENNDCGGGDEYPFADIDEILNCL